MNSPGKIQKFNSLKILKDNFDFTTTTNIEKKVKSPKKLQLQKKNSTIRISQIEGNIALMVNEIKSNQKKQNENKRREEDNDIPLEQRQKNYDLLKLDDMAYKTINFILNKTKRSKEEILIISVYLSTLQKFLNIVNKSKNYQNLINNLSSSLKSEKKPKNSIIMRFGDKGKKCYILLQGHVSILIPKETNVKLTLLVFYKHLILLKVIGEEELFKKTLIANKNTQFYFEEIEIENDIKSIENYIKKSTPLKNIILQKFNSYDISEIFEYYIYIKKKFVPYNPVSTVEEYIKNTYLYNNHLHPEDKFTDLKTAIIYQYYEVIQKDKGDIFGEVALQNSDKKRTATIICLDDCIFGCLSREEFNGCLRDIEVKQRRNEVNFVLSFNIFKGMNWTIFENKFFNYFKLETVSQGKTIINQNSHFDFIYLVKKGEFELTSSLTLKEIKDIVKEKVGKTLNIKNKFFPNNKKNYRIALINNKDVIGLDDIIYNDKSFVNVICTSPEAIIYALDRNILYNFTKKMAEVKNNIEIITNLKINALMDRLTEFFLVSENTNVEEYKKIMKIKKEKNPTEIFKELQKKEIPTGTKNRIKSGTTRISKKLNISLGSDFYSNYCETVQSRNNNTDKNFSNYKNSTFSIQKNPHYFSYNVHEINKDIRVINLYNLYSKKKRNENDKYKNTLNKLGDNNETYLKNDNFLKLIIGTKYKNKRIESDNQYKLRKKLIDNKKNIFNNLTNRNQKIKPAFVDLLYYDTNITEDSKSFTINNKKQRPNLKKNYLPKIIKHFNNSKI